MKSISEHLGQIIVALAAIALCIAITVACSPAISDMFGNVTDTLTEKGEDMLDGIKTPAAGEDGAGGGVGGGSNAGTPAEILPTGAEYWENGSVTQNGNQNDGVSSRLRTVNVLPIEGSKSYVLNLSADYEADILQYNNGVFVKQSYYQPDGTILDIPDNINGFRVVLKHKNNQAVTPDTPSNITISITRAPQEYTLMTFNLGRFYDGANLCPDDYVDTQKAAYKQLFSTYNPDLIFTQEQEKYANASKNILGNGFFADNFENIVGTEGGLGKKFISNMNIENFTNIAFSNERDFNKAYVEFNGLKVAVFNVHLGLTEDIRATQITELLKAVEKEEYVIIAGDFNCNPTSDGELKPFVDNGYKLGNGGELGTIFTIGSNSYDNIIVSSNIELVSHEVPDNSPSDHKPFILKVRL